jgi:dihydrofolate reductase
MGRLVVNNAVTVNGAFEAPAPEPDGWLVLDADSNQVSLEQFLVADAMVLGRKTYEGLAAVWPQLADDPSLGVFADRMNSMPSTWRPGACTSLWSGTPPFWKTTWPRA